jgi:integrase
MRFRHLDPDKNSLVLGRWKRRKVRKMMSTEIDLIRLWRLDCQGRGITDLVIKHYENYLREYRRDARPLLGSTTFDLSSFLLERSGRWAPATKMYVRRAFRSFFRFALEAGAIDEDPAAALKSIKVPTAPVRTPGQAERLTLVGACLNRRDVAIVDVLFGTGMRRAELAALTIDDVDIVEGTIEIRKSKNGRPRTAVMDERARRATAAWLDERAQLSPVHEELWLNELGGVLKSSGIRMVLRRISKRSGVVFSSHDARRAFAVAWLAMGGSETGLMAVCGWSSTSMIARYVRERQTTLAVEEARRLFAA